MFASGFSSDQDSGQDVCVCLTIMRFATGQSREFYQIGTGLKSTGRFTAHANYARAVYSHEFWQIAALQIRSIIYSTCRFYQVLVRILPDRYRPQVHNLPY